MKIKKNLEKQSSKDTNGYKSQYKEVSWNQNACNTAQSIFGLYLVTKGVVVVVLEGTERENLTPL